MSIVDWQLVASDLERQRDELAAENARLLAELSTALQQVKTEQRLSFRDQVADLEQQREELLAALEKIAEVCNGYDLEAGWACKHARAAIAKVKP